MAKRFGRNQRRRMRENLAAAVEHITALHFHNRGLEAMLDEARRNLDYISDAIKSSSEFSTLLPPRRRRTDSFDANRREHIPDRDLSMGPSDAPISLTSRLSYADMAMVGMQVQDDPMRYAYNMHMFLEGAGKLDGQWRYSIARRTLEQSAIHPRVLDELTHRLARQLMTQFLRDCDRKRYG